MSRQRTVHRADFSVRCTCGNTFNTNDSHIGKQLRCRCGRVLTIARPVDEYIASAPPSAPPATGGTRRKSRKTQSATAPRTSPWRWRWRSSAPRWPRASRWATRLAWAYFAATLVAWWMLVMKSEEWLLATLLLYGPRWPLAIPLLLLAPLSLLAWPRVPRTMLPLVLAAVVIAWPIMGGRVSLATLGKPMPAQPAPGTFRVMTFNTFGGIAVAERIEETFALRPDIAAFQECGETLHAALRALKDVYVAKYRSLCTVSRWPITAIDSMPRLADGRGAALAARHHIATPFGPLLFVNVHFETARKGLEMLTKDGSLVPNSIGGILHMAVDVLVPDAATSRQLMMNTVTRTRESAHASRWAIAGAGDTAVLVAGDFNLPVESTIYWQYWRAYQNAFERSGTGFGFTKSEGELLRVRIDHVLGNANAPRPAGTWIGPELGSDHRPVIVDYLVSDANAAAYSSSSVAAARMPSR